MKPKIEKYIKIAEGWYLRDKEAGVIRDADYLARALGYDTIPCCSMTREDQAQLRVGLENMIKDHQRQLSLQL